MQSPVQAEISLSLSPFRRTNSPRDAMVATATPSTQKVQPEMRTRSEADHEQQDAALGKAAAAAAVEALSPVGDMLC